MKKQILIASLVALSTASFAQQVITNKGDKVAVTDLKVEPWRVENSATQATGNTQKIYQNNAVGIGDFTGTTMPAGTTLNIKPTGNIQMRFLSPTGASFSEYFLDGDYATRKAWFGFGSGTTPTLFTINNSITDGVINIDSKTVGVKTPSPLTDFQVTGSGLVTGNLSVAYAVADRMAPASDSYLNVGMPAGINKAAARFSINNCGEVCNQVYPRNIILNNFNGTPQSSSGYGHFGSIGMVATPGDLGVAPTPAVEILGIERDPVNNYGGFGIRTTGDAAGLQNRFLIHRTGRIDIKNVGATADNTLTKVLAVNDNGQIGYVDKSAIASGTAAAQEPWQVAGSATQATSNTASIYQNANVGIGDFSAAGNVPTQKLDVAGNARVRSMVDVNTDALNAQYTNVVVADANGVLGVHKGTPNVSTWNFNDIQSNGMPAPISTTIGSGNVDLGLFVDVQVPANSQMQVLVGYNVPIIHNGGVGYMGITLKKTMNGTTAQLDQGSRKYTVPGTYNQGTIGAPAHGMPIAGNAVEVLVNNTTAPITVRYDAQGYVEGNGSSVVFGGYSASGANYNWGRGTIYVQTFVKPN